MDLKIEALFNLVCSAVESHIVIVAAVELFQVFQLSRAFLRSLDYKFTAKRWCYAAKLVNAAKQPSFQVKVSDKKRNGSKVA
jgi:hypothetical protein